MFRAHSVRYQRVLTPKCEEVGLVTCVTRIWLGNYTKAHSRRPLFRRRIRKVLAPRPPSAQFVSKMARVKNELFLIGKDFELFYSFLEEDETVQQEIQGEVDEVK